MDILDIITTRKSVRRYKPDPVPDELLMKVLEAGRWAATGENYQPWILIVVRKPETRRKIGELSRLASGAFCSADFGMGKLQKRFEGIQDPVERARVMKFMYTGEVSLSPTNAPVIIMVAGTVKNGLNTPYDLSACLENMLLEAHSLGLGACWVEGPVAPTRRMKKMKELLKVPTGMGDFRIHAYMSLGWPQEQRKHPRPKKSLEEIVYWEEFGNKNKEKI